MLRLTEIGIIGSTAGVAFSFEKIVPWILFFMGCPMLVFLLIEILKNRAYFLVIFASGHLSYDSLNSLSWVFDEKSRYTLAHPMIAGIMVSVFVLICCLA